MAKDAYYFPHDANARHDPDICHMRSVYGMQGYGWFWVLVEILREQDDYKLKLCKCNAYAMQMQCEENATEKFIKDCINTFDLFESDGTYFWSPSLIRRMQKFNEKSEKARKSALSRWTSERNADVMRTQCDGNASKVNKSKVNKNIYTFVETDLPLILANELFTLIQNNNPTVKQPNLQSWAVDIDRMIRLDKRTETQIRDMIQFSQTDQFWQTNILSANKLREKYDQLYLKSKNNQSNKPNAPPKPVAKKDKFKALYQT